MQLSEANAICLFFVEGSGGEHGNPSGGVSGKGLISPRALVVEFMEWLARSLFCFDFLWSPC